MGDKRWSLNYQPTKTCNSREHDETLANPLNILEKQKKFFTALPLNHSGQKLILIDHEFHDLFFIDEIIMNTYEIALP